MVIWFIMPSEKKSLQILIYSKFAHYKNVFLFVDWLLFHYYIIHQRLAKISYFKLPQFSSVSQSCLTLCDPMDCSMPGFPVHHWHSELTQTQSIELVMPSNHLILCYPLLLLPLIFPSIMVFSNDSAFRIRWPKYWSFSFSISPSNEHSGLISFRMHCWISLQSKGLSRVFSKPQFRNIDSLVLSFLYIPNLTSIHDH